MFCISLFLSDCLIFVSYLFLWSTSMPHAHSGGELMWGPELTSLANEDDVQKKYGKREFFSEFTKGKERKIFFFFWIHERNEAMLSSNIGQGQKDCSNRWPAGGNENNKSEITLTVDVLNKSITHTHTHTHLSLIHIWRCRRGVLCRSRWSPYH